MDGRPMPSTRKPNKAKSAPRRRGVTKTAELLNARYDEVEAQEIVARELLRARRARSRTQFAFWTAVAAELKLRKLVASGDHQMEAANRAAGKTSGTGLTTKSLEGNDNE